MWRTHSTSASTRLRPAISIERFLLTLDGNYTSEGLAVRGRDFRAVDTINPFPLKLTWEQLNDGL